MLIMNAYRDSCCLFTPMGGITMSDEKNAFIRHENWLASVGDTMSTTMAEPNGYYPPTAYNMPMKAGNLVSRNKIIGTGSITVTGQLGYELAATIIGSGGITSALGELVVDLMATLSGSGSLTADIEGMLEGIATLSGSGSVDATIEAIAEMSALLSGEGNIISDLEGIGEMSVIIRSYGALTAEGLRDAIWQAAATNYEDPQTMGGKLNNAGAAANPWDVIIGDMTAGETIESILKLTGNKVTKSGNIITIYESDGVTVWKEFDLTGGGRTEV